IIAPLEEKLARRKLTEALKIVYRKRALLKALSGKVNTILKIEILNGHHKIQTYQLERAAFTGQMSQALGNFAAQRTVFESKCLPNNIGYIRFNIWVISQMPKIREAINALSATQGIIFDLRGNPGGVGAMTTGTAGLLVKEQTSLGTNKSRSAENQ